MSDQASTSGTLVGFGAIATDSFDGRKKAEHSWFQSQEGLMAGNIPNSQEKSIRASFKTHAFVLAKRNPT